MATKINKSSDGLALGGYDPVAYFQEGKPVKGKKEFEHEWNGAKWHFSSAANHDLFTANPEKYTPQYGNFCAWGMSQGKFFDGDPEVWKVVDGKLYVNFNKDIEKTWVTDIPGFIKKANDNWPRMQKE